MDTLTRQDIEEHVEREVYIMLTEGDKTYLNRLSRDALLKALETELYFLGIYPDEDQETPVFIQNFLRLKLDEWWQTPNRRVQLTESPFVAWRDKGSVAGSLIRKQHINFKTLQKSVSNPINHNSSQTNANWSSVTTSSESINVKV